MNVGTAHSELNPTHSYFNSKGMWLTYLILVGLLHLLLISFPFLSVAQAWTLTNVLHNITMFFILHITKGTPWETGDQGKDRYLTQWEQIDYGQQFTATRKFLTMVPIVLFFLASFYTKYDSNHFIINVISLGLVLVPKLPLFHGVRIFNINKY